MESILNVELLVFQGRQSFSYLILLWWIRAHLFTSSPNHKSSWLSFLRQKNIHLHIGMIPNAVPFSLQKRKSQQLLSISEHFTFTQYAQRSLILTKDGWKWLMLVCFVCCETAVLPTTCFPKHHLSFFPLWLCIVRFKEIIFVYYSEASELNIKL